MQWLVVKPEARATRGYFGGLNGQRDGRVAAGNSWLQVAKMGSRNLPKVEKQTFNCHNFGSTDGIGVL